MATAVLEMPKMGCPPSDIGAIGAFFQPSSTSESDLVRSDERLITELVGILDRQLLKAVDARSVAELRRIRHSVYPRYVRALRALNDTVENLVSTAVLQRITDHAFVSLSADLAKQEARFGSKLAEQAVFTLWTVKKIRALARQIVTAGDLPAKHKKEDYVLFHEYHSASLWAQFHLDTVFAAMKFDRPISEEIRESIHDGLRAAVDAYTIMKDALALRQEAAVAEVSAQALPWDDEDERLLAMSMRDINADFSERS